MFGNTALRVGLDKLDARIKKLEEKPAVVSDGGGAVADAWGRANRDRVEKLEKRIDELERRLGR